MLLNIYTCSWYSGIFLETNYQILKQLNPSLEFRWIICDHNPDDLDDIILQPEYVIFKRNNNNHAIGSISHGRGLNFLIEQSKINSLTADYHLFLDPDFYIFQPIKPYLDFVEKNNIDVFGATYCEKLPMLFDYPAAFCELFRNKTVDISTLDFSTAVHKKRKGFIREVGHLITLDIMANKYTFYTIKGFRDVENHSVDIYFNENSLFAAHIHTRRYNRKYEKAERANVSLANLPYIYNMYKTNNNNNIDFSFLYNFDFSITEDNFPKKIKPKKNIVLKKIKSKIKTNLSHQIGILMNKKNES